MNLIKWGFGQAKKKKITARMYRKLEQQKKEARSMHIPKGKLEDYLRERKLVEKELA